MGLFGFLTGNRGRSERLTGHISEPPEITVRGASKYLVFRLAEVPDTIFHIKMFPLTPTRQAGDFVEVVFTRGGETSDPVTAEAVIGLPDASRKRPWAAVPSEAD